MNSIIGTGVLSVPFAISVFGGYGPPALLIASLLNLISLHILIECPDLSKNGTEIFKYSQLSANLNYGMISNVAIGIFKGLLQVCIFFTSFGISVSCMIEIGHTLPRLAKNLGLTLSAEYSIFLTLILILPVLFKESLNANETFSIINWIFSVLLISSLFYLLFLTDSQTQVLESDHHKLPFNSAFNIIIISLQFHQNVIISRLLSSFSLFIQILMHLKTKNKLLKEL